jgi:hypothetical protein
MLPTSLVQWYDALQELIASTGHSSNAPTNIRELIQ